MTTIQNLAFNSRCVGVALHTQTHSERGSVLELGAEEELVGLDLRI